MPPTPVNLPAISPQQHSSAMEPPALPYQPAPTPIEMQMSHSLPNLDETPAPPMPLNEMQNMGYDPPMDVEEPFAGLPAQTPGALSERAPPTPWHDDYDMAPSVGPVSLFVQLIFVLFLKKWPLSYKSFFNCRLRSSWLTKLTSSLKSAYLTSAPLSCTTYSKRNFSCLTQSLSLIWRSGITRSR